MNANQGILGLDGEGRVCAAPRCQRIFVPSTKKPAQAYCSQGCWYERRLVDDGHIVCSRCGVVKSAGDFDFNSGGLLGRRSRCRNCESILSAERYVNGARDRDRHHHRRNHARRKYGLTLEEMDEILARGCAICGATNVEARICIDHDHATGKVRDALCHGCNVGLGAFGDAPERMRAAAEYIESHRA